MSEHLRIVSLLASGTEIVAELGALDQLVGRSHECDWPPSVRDLPALSTIEIDVTGSSADIDAQVKERSAAATLADSDAALNALSLYHIDPERLRELRPDVIITQTQCEVCAVSERDVAAALAQLTGFTPRIVSLAPHQLADVWDDIIRVGQAIGRESQARERVTAYTERIAALAHDQPSIRPSVAALEWLDPLMGAGNWMPELIQLAGGDPSFGKNGEHSPWLTWDDLRLADPDIIILAPCGFTIERTLVDVPILQAHPLWKDLRAVKNHHVYCADGNALFNRSGPRLVESAEVLAAIITGSQQHRGWWQPLEEANL